MSAARVLVWPMRSISSRNSAHFRQRVPGMAEIVEVQVRQASRLDGLGPDAAVEVAVPQWQPGRAGEYERVGLIRDEAREMPAQVGRDQVGERHAPDACLRLGRPKPRLARDRLGELPVDADRAGAEVD